jgi:uncharacterized membrane protein
MPPSDEVRKHRWALLIIALGFLFAAFLCYRTYASTDSFFRPSDSPTAWIAAVIFIFIGVAVWFIRISYRKHDVENAKHNAERTDITKR